MPEIFQFYINLKKEKGEKEKNISFNRYIGKREREQSKIDRQKEELKR